MGHDHHESGQHGHGDHDAHHDHPKELGHHWDNLNQQFEAGKLGMWLFLATEILLFGGLFCGYAIWRGNHPEIFAYGSQFLSVKWGAINTCVLLLSSMTMAMGVTMAQRGNKPGLIICLVLTLLGAFGFLAIKYVEYSHKIHEGLLPGLAFYEKPADSHIWVEIQEHEGEAHTATIASDVTESQEEAALALARADLPSLPPAEATTNVPAAIGPSGLNQSKVVQEEETYRVFYKEGRIAAQQDQAAMAEFADHPQEAMQELEKHPLQDPDRPPNAQKFFTIYFLMTGLHGFHVVAGVIVILWLIYLTFRGRFNRQYYTPVDCGGLYWHVVDLIWIFLFPLFYLI